MFCPANEHVCSFKAMQPGKSFDGGSVLQQQIDQKLYVFNEIVSENGALLYIVSANIKRSDNENLSL